MKFVASCIASICSSTVAAFGWASDGVESSLSPPYSFFAAVAGGETAAINVDCVLPRLFLAQTAKTASSLDVVVSSNPSRAPFARATIPCALRKLSMRSESSGMATLMKFLSNASPCTSNFLFPLKISVIGIVSPCLSLQSRWLTPKFQLKFSVTETMKIIPGP